MLKQEQSKVRLSRPAFFCLSLLLLILANCNYTITEKHNVLQFSGGYALFNSPHNIYFIPFEDEYDYYKKYPDFESFLIQKGNRVKIYEFSNSKIDEGNDDIEFTGKYYPYLMAGISNDLDSFYVMPLKICYTNHTVSAKGFLWSFIPGAPKYYIRKGGIDILWMKNYQPLNR